MKKELSALGLIFSLLATMSYVPAVSAQEVETDTQTEADIALTDIGVDEISDEELTEAEPSELPEEEADLEFTEELEGAMLLDVEGNGEVYYVDPVDGGKEYLANGASAHALLERRALGINEENFAGLDQGTEKDEPSVCGRNELATRLRGRIVLRVEMNGEAWWILPTNCRAYYVGTHEAAYELMRKFSLGIIKKNLARIPDTARQRLKRAIRFSVFAYAQENDVSLAEARDAVRTEAHKVRECVREANVDQDADITRADIRLKLRECHQASDLPALNRERISEIKEDIQEVRKMRRENRAELRDIRIDEMRLRSENRQTAEVR